MNRIKCCDKIKYEDTNNIGNKDFGDVRIDKVPLQISM